MRILLNNQIWFVRGIPSFEVIFFNSMHNAWLECMVDVWNSLQSDMKLTTIPKFRENGNEKRQQTAFSCFFLLLKEIFVDTVTIDKQLLNLETVIYTIIYSHIK